MNREHNRKSGEGFSLVEVNLAILLVALGMLALFGLFPAGLREADLAMTDTHEALFADYVLSGLEANASTSTTWSVWKDMGDSNVVVQNPSTPTALFQRHIVKGVRIPVGSQDDIRWRDARAGPPPPQQNQPVVEGPVSYAGRGLFYILEIGGTDYRLWTNNSPLASRTAAARWPGATGSSTPPPSPQWRSASLWVMSAEHVGNAMRGDLARFKKNATPFHSELYYPGSMP